MLVSTLVGKKDSIGHIFLRPPNVCFTPQFWVKMNPMVVSSLVIKTPKPTWIWRRTTNSGPKQTFRSVHWAQMRVFQGAGKRLQDGPLPVMGRVMTPLTGMKYPHFPIYSRPWFGPIEWHSWEDELAFLGGGWDLVECFCCLNDINDCFLLIADFPSIGKVCLSHSKETIVDGYIHIISKSVSDRPLEHVP